MNNRPIVVIDDDEDDRELMEEIFKSLAYENEVKFYSSADVAWERFLNDPDDIPLLVLSDGQMPRMNGYELRDKIKQTPHLQDVPFVFLSTSEHHAPLQTNQGYFSKPASFDGLKKTISLIVEYWRTSIPPARR
jgi:CheY-like chemotaxis protein